MIFLSYNKQFAERVNVIHTKCVACLQADLVCLRLKKPQYCDKTENSYPREVLDAPPPQR